MSRKILALIIAVAVVVCVYGAFYAVVTAVLMPQDLNSFKDELNMIPPAGINESTINQMESEASVIESAPLIDIPPDQRTAMANEMRSKNAVPPGVLNQNFSMYKDYNDARAFKYDIILKGNVSSEIRNISTTYEKINSLCTEMVSINQKMATDFGNGDNKAYAEDFRKMTSTMKQYNNAMAELRTKLQNMIKQLGG